MIKGVVRVLMLHECEFCVLEHIWGALLYLREAILDTVSVVVVIMMVRHVVGRVV